MTVSCKIQFCPERSNGYFSGDYITGQMILQTTCELPIREIYVMLEGKIHIEWENLESKNKQGFIHYYMQSYKNEDTILTIRQILLNNTTIKRGEHLHQFIIQIPETIPSSCSIKSSYIKYEFSVIIQDAVNVQQVQTIPLLIRRRFQKYIKAATTDSLEIFRRWPCRSQPLIASVTLNATTFSPGSYMEYTILMDKPNKYFDVQYITVVLLQFTHYTAKEPRERQRRDVTSVAFKSYDKPCNAFKSSTLKDCLKLPNTLLNTSIDECALMISYKLQIDIEMGFYQKSGSLTLPIIIDTWCDMHEKQTPYKDAALSSIDDINQPNQHVTLNSMDGIILEPKKEIDVLEVSV